jgi:hypothetical protein
VLFAETTTEVSTPRHHHGKSVDFIGCERNRLSRIKREVVRHRDDRETAR